MAFFNDLVRVIAAAEGLEEITVSGIGQYAREAGHISKGGRGRSAALMTSADAAKLLIAVNGTDLAKNAAATIDEFSRLETDGKAINELSKAGSSFGSDLESLIASCRIPDWRSRISSDPSSIVVRFIRPIFEASIFVLVTSNGDRKTFPKSSYYGSDISHSSQTSGYGGDRRVETVITQATVFAVADVLDN